MITIGADPEFFVRRKNHWVSGHLFPCGTKENPRRTKHGWVQVDGTALEFNITPARSRSDFVRRIKTVREDLERVVRRTDDACALVAKPSIYFGKTFLRNLPIQARRLGCTPDFSAYTGNLNLRPDETSPIRTGSGHVHIGFTKTETPHARFYIHACCSLVRQLDFCLGLPSLLWDTDQRRRSLYGKAGAFRPKVYGLEYRTLSNAWLDNDDLIGFVFDRSVKAVQDYLAGNTYDRYGEFAREMIDTGNADWPKLYPELAQELLS